ncbi:MAG: hypothetical protein M3535_06275 [Actinomycetota bacterium]|jgi:hypothetical protein|nr:hypothetical protein [Actinomycetota bacterium]
MKQRLTVSVEAELVEAGKRAVGVGEASSLSAWVNAALADRADKDRRLQALAAAIADFEADFGEITSEEIAVRRRADRETAVVVRGRKVGSQGRSGRGGKAVS